MNNYITAPITACVNFNHMVKYFCLPLKTACNGTVIDGLFALCGNLWNCNKKCATDINYYFPVPEDGKIQFQTNFSLSTDSVLGTDIEIKLYDLNDNEIEADWNDYVSRWVVGQGYQTIEIDFAEVPIDCGSFKISVGEGVVCTEQFKKRPCSCLVEIEGIVSDKDCWNNYYGTSQVFTGTNFAYSNRIYLEGNAKYFGTNTTTKGMVEVLRFIPTALIAPYMQRYIAHKILKSKQVIINGETWNTKDTQMTPRERSSMFWPIMEFERKVCSDNTGCN